MDKWTTSVHEGYRTKIIKIGNNTIEINRPILTKEEQEEREDAIMQAIAQMG